MLTGGTGDDTFVFSSRLDSQPGARDQITDFSISHDKLDFSSIGDFTFIGTGAFDGPREVRQGLENGHATIEVNTTGNSGAEMVVNLVGTGSLTASNFILSGNVTTDDANHNTFFPSNPGARHRKHVSRRRRRGLCLRWRGKRHPDGRRRHRCGARRRWQ